jgi:serine-type D-Ala-D-Ala carboxypeptidase (penicillin-binding protein 5/6)
MLNAAWANRPIHRKLICLLCALASLALMGFGPPVLTDGGHPAMRLYPEQVETMRRLKQPPAISAAAAVVYDVDAGQTLYALHEHQPLPPASTAKLMTALLTLQHGDLTAKTTVSHKAATTGGSTMGLQPGETLTIEDLLYGLLLPSGNDAAMALAEYVGGDEAAFVAQMNRIAAQMGLRETHFVNPHGLDDPQQLASAADLLALARADLAYPVFAKIVATQSMTVAGHALASTNELLGAYPGADGVKTGTTDEAGQCLVASVTRGGHRLLVVLMHSQDRYADARLLLDFAAAGWAWRPLALADNALAWQTGADGHIYRLRAAPKTNGLFLPTWEWPLVRSVVVISPTATLTGALPVGTLELTLAGQPLASVPLTVWSGP